MEINETEEQNRKTREKNQWNQSRFFENINIVDNPLVRLTTKEKKKTQIIIIKNKRRNYWPYRNKMNYKEILWTTICPKLDKWYGQIPRKTQTTKTKSRRNKQSECICNKQRNLTNMKIGAWEQALLGKSGMSGITWLKWGKKNLRLRLTFTETACPLRLGLSSCCHWSTLKGWRMLDN